MDCVIFSRGVSHHQVWFVCLVEVFSLTPSRSIFSIEELLGLPHGLSEISRLDLHVVGIPSNRKTAYADRQSY